MKTKLIRQSFLIVLTLLACCSSGCRQSTGKKIDEFYTDKGDWDAGRIPFLKPYEAVNATKEFGWFMNLRGYDLDTGFPNIQKATIVNGVIFVFATNTILHGVDVKQSWHIIIPQKHIEKGFDKYDGYKAYIKGMGIQSEPRLHDIESIADYFEHHVQVDWNAVE